MSSLRPLGRSLGAGVAYCARARPRAGRLRGQAVLNVPGFAGTPTGCGESQTWRLLPPEQGSPRPCGAELASRAHALVREGGASGGSCPMPAPPHIPCSLKPQTTEPGKTGQGLREQWGEGARAEATWGSGSRVWMSNTRVLSLEGRLRRGRKHSVYKSAKERQCSQWVSGENVQPAALAGRGAGGQQERREGAERGRGPFLRAAAGEWEPWVGAVRSQVERPLQAVRCSPTGPPVSPQSLTPMLCTQELLQLGEAALSGE